MSLPVRPPPLMSLFVCPSVAAFVSPAHTQSSFSSASPFPSSYSYSLPVSTTCDTPPSNSTSPTPQFFPGHTPACSSFPSPSPIPIVQSLLSWLLNFLISTFLNYCAPLCVPCSPCSTQSSSVPCHSPTPVHLSPPKYSWYTDNIPWLIDVSLCWLKNSFLLLLLLLNLSGGSVTGVTLFRPFLLADTVRYVFVPLFWPRSRQSLFWSVSVWCSQLPLAQQDLTATLSLQHDLEHVEL